MTDVVTSPASVHAASLDPSSGGAASDPAGSSRADGVADVAHHVVELMRSFSKARARLTQIAEHDVEWASHMILRALKSEGSMRAGALAEYLNNDPSTVSRQVATLVKDGYLERRADPDDGRASLLVLTERAEHVLADHDRLRLEYFAHMLDDWNDDELTAFARSLGRFTDAYRTADSGWFKNWLDERAHRTGSTD